MITRMWHRGLKWANAVDRMVPIDLLDRVATNLDLVKKRKKSISAKCHVYKYLHWKKIKEGTYFTYSKESIRKMFMQTSTSLIMTIIEILLAKVRQLRIF